MQDLKGTDIPESVVIDNNDKEIFTLKKIKGVS